MLASIIFLSIFCVSFSVHCMIETNTHMEVKIKEPCGSHHYNEYSNDQLYVQTLTEAKLFTFWKQNHAQAQRTKIAVVIVNIMRRLYVYTCEVLLFLSVFLLFISLVSGRACYLLLTHTLGQCFHLTLLSI